MSPEILENIPYNEKTDCWSLGVILYELITLSHPFYDRGKDKCSLKELVDRVSDGKYTSISTLIGAGEIPGGYSKSLGHIVDRLLCKDYDRRMSCEEVL
jgi:serine/threonine protein kinase